MGAPVRFGPLALFLATALVVGCTSRPTAVTPSPGGTTPPGRDGAATTTPVPPTPGADRYQIQQDKPPARRPDISHVREPEVRHEPRSRYGNHSPYMVFGKTYHVLPDGQDYRAEGVASWYGAKFHGHRTSSGEPYDMYQFTAAHRSLPLPSFARVTNLDNGQSVVVRINDRGPFHPDREIDLSWAAAVRLGIEQRGTGRVRVEVLTPQTAVAGTDPAPTRPAPTRSSPAPSRPVSSVSASLSSPPPALELYLQVGAFSQAGRARQTQEKVIRDFALPAQVREPDAGQDRLYRVWVGPFATEALREHAHDRLYRAGYGEPLRVMP